MIMTLRSLILSLALSIGLAVVAGPVLAAPDWKVEPNDMTLGSAKAPVTVIEYASASCPHCAWFNNEVFPAFKAKYIDTGKVRYVMREFLTPPEQVAALGFLAARCGGPAHYFTILDQIFRHQAEIYQNNDLQGVLLKAAKAGGVGEAQLNACLYDGKALAALNERVNTYISRDDVNGTPTFVVNGKPLPDGEKTLVQMDEAIADALKAQGGKAPRKHQTSGAPSKK
jgi:protein-disulfide isomerase